MTLYATVKTIETLLGLVARRLAARFMDRLLSSARVKSKILAGLLKEPGDWIGKEYAVMMVSSMDFADARKDELVREFHMEFPGFNAPVEEARKYIAEVEQDVPRRILEVFVEKHPRAYKDGRYQRSVLLLWLRS